MIVTAKLKNLRISPRKVRIVANLIRGMQVDEALIQLRNTFKKSSVNVEKLLASAIANAENNFKLDRTNLFIKEISVGEAGRLKRWLPRAHGRATLLLKRMSHIKIALEEKEVKEKKAKEETKETKKTENAEKKAPAKKKVAAKKVAAKKVEKK